MPTTTVNGTEVGIDEFRAAASSYLHSATRESSLVQKGAGAMTIKQNATTDRTYEQAVLARIDAARALHSAEIAVHDAHQTHVDAWIGAANDRLHLAVAQYLAADALVCGLCAPLPAA